MCVAISVPCSTLFLFLLFMAFFLCLGWINGNDFEPDSSKEAWSNSLCLFLSCADISLLYFASCNWSSFILSSAHLHRHIMGRIKSLQWEVNFFFLQYVSSELIYTVWLYLTQACWSYLLYGHQFNQSELSFKCIQRSVQRDFNSKQKLIESHQDGLHLIQLQAILLHN